jgi:cytoskeletal protein RodZ
MNDTTISESRSVGTLLRTSREESGRTLRDLASVTRIQASMLQCLEEDRFEELPAEVFCRGFLRSYARELGLDADAILTRYLQQRAGVDAVPGHVALPLPAAASQAAVDAAVDSTSALLAPQPGPPLSRIAWISAVVILAIGLIASMVTLGTAGGRQAGPLGATADHPAADWSQPNRALPETMNDWRSYRRN